MTTPGRDKGAAVLELALLAPVFLVLLCLVVGFGRVGHGKQVVERAASAGARAASLSASPGAAASAGEAAARDVLDQAGVSCSRFRVDVSTGDFRPGGQVSARVLCSADLADLALAGLPGSVDLRATSLAPLDPYRDFGS